MSQPQRVDVAILGAGSGGENLAAQLARRGLEVAVVEERLVGGECPYFACMPSKALLHDAFVDRSFEEAARRRDAVAEHYDDHDHVADLEAAGVRVLRGRGRIVAPGQVAVDLDARGTAAVQASHIVLATGAREPTLEVPGADRIPIWSSEDAWTSSRRPDRLLVVGGGAVGTEVAAAYARFGSRVVLIDRGERLLDPEDHDVTDAATAHLRGLGTDVRNHTSVQRLDGDERAARVTLTDGDVLEVDQVVACLGKRRRTHDVGLESLGLDPEHLSVGTDGRVVGADTLWALGDVSGHPPYTHTANAMADVIAHNLTNPDGEPATGSRHLDLASNPRCVFLHPPLAAVGSTTPSDEHVRVSMDLANVARGYADGVDGTVAVLSAARADRRVTGFSAFGPGVDEVVNVAALAIAQRLTVDELARHVAPFPTYSDVVPVLCRRAVDALDG